VRTRRFIGDGGVDAVETVEIDSSFSEIRGTKQVWPAQLVLLAMGFLGPEKEGLISQLGLVLNEKSLVAVDANKMTSTAGVFAAGDIERGQSLVVWAVADGRKAAACVDKYLMSATETRHSVRYATAYRVL
jgi:glutamate synthase (NADPH/NADH) small chain